MSFQLSKYFCKIYYIFIFSILNLYLLIHYNIKELPFIYSSPYTYQQNAYTQVLL